VVLDLTVTMGALIPNPPKLAAVHFVAEVFEFQRIQDAATGTRDLVFSPVAGLVPLPDKGVLERGRRGKFKYFLAWPPCVCAGIGNV
jgi:hypothetical protein